ncbi:hypothetical protein Csa_002475 [Cucumis sativus]|uniref:Uncharacterized protein n=1 Tax=Cucumis sativus TaxID=3659 RepID=A0A0A0LC55_CUCSA|nr:hypothetical protein Csa_002475 [Cucumis sativus]
MKNEGGIQRDGGEEHNVKKTKVVVRVGHDKHEGCDGDGGGNGCLKKRGRAV